MDPDPDTVLLEELNFHPIAQPVNTVTGGNLWNHDALDHIDEANELFSVPRWDAPLGAATVDIFSDFMSGHVELPPLTPEMNSERTPQTEQEQPAKRRATRKRRIENGYRCTYPHCLEAYDTAGELSKHWFRKHTPESDWPFACATCGKRFCDKRDYARHLKVESRRESLSTTAQSQNTPQSVSQAQDQDVVAPVRPDTQSTFDWSSAIHQPPRETPPLRETSHSGIMQGREISPKPIDFHRPNQYHNSAGAALEAISSDLLSFFGLRTVQITITAVVPSQEDTITFNAVHRIAGNVPSTTSSATPAASAKKPLVSRLTESAQMGDLAMEHVVDAGLASPASSYPSALVNIRDKRFDLQAITVRVRDRTRPDIRRSITHPGQQTVKNGKLDGEHGSNRQRLWSMVRRLSLSGNRVR